jgi:hypothetical protein
MASGVAHNAWVLRILATGLVVAGVLVCSTAPAEASPLVDKGDRHGDVSVSGSIEGVDPAVVDSVDLRHVMVTRQGDGVRVVIRLKQVLPVHGRWFQEIGVSMSAPPGWHGVPTWIFLANATPQHLGSALAFYLEADSVVEPKPCRVAASKGAKVVRLVIPQRCLPKDAGQLTVSSVLLDKRGDNPLLAEDDVVVGGLVDLQPGR